MENQQGPAGQPREVCPILCDNLMVTRGKDGGRDSQGVWDGRGHTAVFNMENQQGPAGQLREVCSMSHGSRDGRGVWGRRDTCTCLAESLRCSPEIIITVLTDYAPAQNEKFGKKKDRNRGFLCCCERTVREPTRAPLVISAPLPSSESTSVCTR